MMNNHKSSSADNNSSSNNKTTATQQQHQHKNVGGSAVCVAGHKRPRSGGNNDTPSPSSSPSPRPPRAESHAPIAVTVLSSDDDEAEGDGDDGDVGNRDRRKATERGMEVEAEAETAVATDRRRPAKENASSATSISSSSSAAAAESQPSLPKKPRLVVTTTATSSLQTAIRGVHLSPAVGSSTTTSTTTATTTSTTNGNGGVVGGGGGGRKQEIDRLKHKITEYDAFHLTTEDNANSEAALKSGGANANGTTAHKKPQSKQQPVGIVPPLNAGPKKFVFKGFKVPPSAPSDFEGDTIKKLMTAVKAIHHSTSTPASYEELYKGVEDLCTLKRAATLYSRLEEQCSKHAQTLPGLIIRDIQTKSQFQFLQSFKSIWEAFCNQMHLIRQIFLYMDRTYALQTHGVYSLRDMGLHHWKQNIAENTTIKSSLLEGLLAVIKSERNGDVIDCVLLSRVIRMYADIDLYRTEFEPPFLKETEDYYEDSSSQHIQSIDLAEYLKWVDGILRSECERVDNYLMLHTKPHLTLTLRQRLIKDHTAEMLSKGFRNLLIGERHSDLHRLYTLLSEVGELQSLRKSFGEYCKECGNEIVQDASRERTMVADLIGLKTRLDKTIDFGFEKNDQFQNSLKDSFEHVINSRKNKPAEMISKYIDEQLQNKNKPGNGWDQVEIVVDHAISLFRLIHGKDVFEAFYKTHLAKRLLISKSADMDCEKMVISKLKAECGSSFTCKLEGMFKDIDLSNDLLGQYKKTCSDEHAKWICPGVDLNVFVLTQAFWPATPSYEITLPSAISELQEHFKAFYLNKFSSRKLQFCNSMGSALLKANYKARRDLIVSMFQSVVLLLFNTADKLSYPEISSSTSLEEEELKKTMQSLVSAKLLFCNSKVLGKEEIYTYNADFKSKMVRVKINSIQMQETVEENSKTKESVFHDRQYQIDAAIVRIMKTRKQLSHTQLISELYKQLSFPVDTGDLKKRIESLIERDYLERDPSNPNMYDYLA